MRCGMDERDAMDAMDVMDVMDAQACCVMGWGVLGRCRDHRIMF